MQTLSAPRSRRIVHFSIRGLHFGPVAFGGGNIGYWIGGSDSMQGAVAQKNAWAVIPQFNWDRGDTGARAGGGIQDISIFSAHQLGFIGLKFDPLPSRTSTIISTVPVDCAVVSPNQIRSGGRRQKVPVV